MFVGAPDIRDNTRSQGQTAFITKEPKPSAPKPGKGDPAAPPRQAAGADAPPAGKPPEQKLTPEEQMELFEKHLKENDWGHQPC
jgi:hypothetical protein